MACRNVFMFSGQGSQYYQMGRALYEQGGTFARHMRCMDEIVQDLGGGRVLDALFGERSKGTPFDDLRLSHPAIFMVEFALAQCVLESGIEPDMTLGVSLGCAAAAVFAGCVGMEEALRWTVRHAAWIVDHCEYGGMIGVLAPPQLHEAEPLRHTSVIAARNGPAHWVLSARDKDLPGIEDFLKSRGVAFGRLPVRYPFHSPWLIDDEAVAFTHVRTPRVGLPRLPVACCAAGGVVTSLDSDYFWRATLLPIQFERTVRQIDAREGMHRFIDLGPSSNLATLLKHLLPADAASRIHGVMSPYGGELAALASLGARAST